MRQFFSIAVLVAAWALAGPPAFAQAPSSAGTQGQQQNPAPKPPQDANPFPEDTNSVPVMPNADTPGTPALPVPDVDTGNIRLPNAEGDPVRSPDETEGSVSGSGSGNGSSSSNSGLDDFA